MWLHCCRHYVSLPKENPDSPRVLLLRVGKFCDLWLGFGAKEDMTGHLILAADLTTHLFHKNLNSVKRSSIASLSPYALGRYSITASHLNPFHSTHWFHGYDWTLYDTRARTGSKWTNIIASDGLWTKSRRYSWVAQQPLADRMRKRVRRWQSGLPMQAPKE